MDLSRLQYLFNRYETATATEVEKAELLGWFDDYRNKEAINEFFIQELQRGDAFVELNSDDWQPMIEKILAEKRGVVRPINRRKVVFLRRIAIAAAVLLLFIAGYWMWVENSATPDDSLSTNEQQDARDVAPPVANKATLKLANGKVIILDSVGTGSLNEMGASNASKVNDGELAYAANGSAIVEYHTLEVPRGSKPMQLQLADGSDVWLNAASSITFPNVFAGPERKVTVTGEAYFEVAKNDGKKFLVDANGTTTEVLGTHFNINAYSNEPAVIITLLEGAVRVNANGQSTTLRPDQQARLEGAGLKVSANVNTGQVMAWKNGLFEFNETDIQTIMRQIERWYNVEVVFEGTVTQHFNGTIQRQVNISKVLNMLEKTGGARFSVEGRKVVVKKY